MKHACRVAGCEAEVEERFLMCREHWAMVPAPIRNAVLEAYREMKKEPELRRAWEAAVKLALASVAGEVPER
jgi:hypothetical protein